jgi:hypothetical protein
MEASETQVVRARLRRVGQPMELPPAGESSGAHERDTEAAGANERSTA